MPILAEPAPSSSGPGIARALRLLQFGDSMLPIGTFAFSGGLESAVQQGVVHDVPSLGDFVRTATRQSAHGDGIAVLHAHRAIRAGDFDGAVAADRAVIERKVNEEFRAMSVRMGKKLAEVGRRVADTPHIDRWLEAIDKGVTPGTLPATLGLIVAELGSPESDAFAIHQYGTAFMIVSAALRLMRVDHLDAQTILFEVDGHGPNDYLAVAGAALDEMATFTPSIDVLAAVHTRSHVRLFMT